MRLAFLIALGFVSSLAIANGEWKAKKTRAKAEAQEAASDVKRGARKAGRAIKDKTCEMVNGKMECAAERVKHSIQNGADQVEDAID